MNYAQLAREAKDAWRRHLGLPPGDTADVAEARDWQSGYIAGRTAERSAGGQDVAAILQEALDDAGVAGEQRKHVMLCFVIAWGRHLQRDLDNAAFAEMISEEEPGPLP